MAWNPSSKVDRESMRFAYDGSDNLEYYAINTLDGIDITLPTWQVFKLVRAGGNLSYIEGPLIGAWDNRTLLAWS